MRVLITVVPRMYRNTLERVLKEERPDLEVSSADPKDLDRELSRFKPHLLVSGELSPGADDIVLCWVHILYEDSLTANVRVGERHFTLHDPSLEDLLGAIDETEQLAREEYGAS